MTTLTILKDYLGIAQSDATQDTALNDMILLAQDEINQYMGRPMYEAPVTDEIQYPRNSLLLSGWPVFTLTTITYGNTPQVLGDFKLDTDIGEVFELADNGYNFDPINQDYAKIEYMSGYPSPYPLWLQDATALVAANLFSKKGSGAAAGGGGSTGIKKQVVQNVYSIEYFDPSSSGTTTVSKADGNIPDVAIEILDLYRARGART